MTTIDRPSRSRDAEICRRTPAALRHLRAEFEGRLDTREGLSAFIDGIGDIAVSNAPPQPRGAAAASVAVAPPDESLTRLKSLYRDHLMGEGSDGGVTAHMAGILGEDVAAAVRSRSAFDDVLRTVLLRTARDLVRDRDQFLWLLSREFTRLDRAWTRLASMERSLLAMAHRPLPPLDFDDLVALDRRLERLEGRATRLHAYRQRQRRDPAGFEDADVPPARFYETVYGPLEGPAPVLADCAVLLERLDEARRGVRRALVTRA